LSWSVCPGVFHVEHAKCEWFSSAFIVGMILA
jgi:hypothetical protein